MNAALVHPGHILLLVTTDTGEDDPEKDAEEQSEHDMSRCYCRQGLMTEKYECEDCSDILRSCSFFRRYHNAEHVFQLMPTRGAASHDTSASDNELSIHEGDNLAEDADIELKEPVKGAGDSVSDSAEDDEGLGDHSARSAARS